MAKLTKLSDFIAGAGSGFAPQRTTEVSESKSGFKRLRIADAEILRKLDARKALMGTQSLISGKNPEEEAEVSRLADFTRMSKSFVASNKEAASVRKNLTMIYGLSSVRPDLVGYFSNPENAITSSDDVESLQGLVKTIDKVKQSYVLGEQNTDLSYAYFDKLMSDVAGSDSKGIDERIAVLEGNLVDRPVDENALETGLTAAAEMLPGLGRSFAAGQSAGLKSAAVFSAGSLIVSGGTATPALPLTAITGYGVGLKLGAAQDIFFRESGSAYRELKGIKDNQGNRIPDNIAAITATGIGAINAGLETIGLSALSKLPLGKQVLGSFSTKAAKELIKNPTVIRKLGDLLTTYGKSITTETLTEIAQEAVSIIATESAKDASDLTMEPLSAKDVTSQLFDAGKEAFAATLTLGIPFAAVNSARVIGARNVQIANNITSSMEDGERLQATFEAADKTKTKKRSPKHMQEFLERSGMNRHVYIDGKASLLLLQEDEDGAKEMFKKLGIDSKEIDGLENGSDLPVRESIIHSRLSKEEFAKIAGKIRTDPSKFTSDDVSFELSSLAGDTQDLLTAAREERRVYEDEVSRIRKQVVKAGATKEMANSYMEILSSFANRMSLSGADVNTFLQKITIRSKSQVSLPQGSANAMYEKFKPLYNQAKSISKKLDYKKMAADGIYEVLAAKLGSQALRDSGIKEYLSSFAGPLSYSDIEKMGRSAAAAKSGVKIRKGALAISDDAFIIDLFGAKDLTTLYHETGHVFLSELEKFGGQNKETLAFKDLQIVKKWLGVLPEDSIDTINQEKFSREFENWISSGQLDSTDILGPMQRYKNWMLATGKKYDDTMAKDIDKVFSRLMSDRLGLIDAIGKAEIRPWTNKQMSELGVTKEDREYMVALLRAASDKAEANLLKKRQKSKKALLSQWRSEALGKYSRNRNAAFAEELRRSDGILASDAKSKFGDTMIDTLRKHGILSEKGLTMEEAAIIGDYDSPDRLADALGKLETQEEFVAREIESAEAAHDSQFNINDYIATTREYEQFLQIKSSYINKKLGRNYASSNAIRKEARAWLDEQPVRTAVSFKRFMASFARHSKGESRSLRKSNLAEASKANHRARQNYALSRAALENRDEVDKLLRLARRLSKRDKKDWQPEYRNSVYDLINRFKLIKSHLDVESHDLRSTIAGKDEDMQEFYASESLLSSEMSYKDMKMGDARELRSLLKYLDKHGKSAAKQELSDGRLVTSVVEDLKAETAGLRKLDTAKIGTLRRWFTDKSRAFYANFDSFNFVMTSMGGYKSLQSGELSATELETSHRLKQAADSEHQMLRQYHDKLNGPYISLLKELRTMKAKYGAKMKEGLPDIPAILSQDQDYWRPEQILAIGMHMGNKSNIARLKQGYGFEDSDLMLISNALSKNAWDAIQAIWDINDELFVEINKVHRSINGYSVKKIEPEALFTQYGIYRGGYAPIRYDINLASRAGGLLEEKIATIHEKTDLMSREESRFQTPHTKSGFTKQRKDKTPYPLMLSLEPIGDHISDTIHYITHAEAIGDINKIIRTDSFRNSVRDHLGIDVYDKLRTALQYIANPRRVSHDPQMEGLIGRMRSMATAWTLALNYKVAAKQFFSSPAAALQLGKKEWLAAYAGFVFNPRSIRAKYDFMMESSPYMSARAKSFDQEFKKAFNLLSAKEKFVIFGDKTYTWSDVVDLGFLPIRAVDTATVVPLWHAAYNKKRKELGVATPSSDAAAIVYADEVIRTTQPSAQGLDLTNAQRAQGVWKLLSMFGTFTIGKYQQRVRLNWRAMRSGAITKKKYAEHIFLEQLVPAIGLAVISRFLDSRESNDDDEALEDIVARSVSTLITTPIPALGNILYPFGSYRYSISPVENVVVAVHDPAKRAYKALASDDFEGAAKETFWTIATLASIKAKVPIAKVVKKSIKSD